MGFRPKRTPCKLDFSGTEYDGLEVTTRPVPMSVLLDVMASFSNAPEDAATARQMMVTFAYALESWNVEDDDGQPIPANEDGLLSQNSQFVNAVLRAWIASLAGSA